MEGFVRVGKVSDVRTGRGRQFEVNGVKVAVFRSGDGFVAVSDTCPHMGASLTNGRLVEGAVECEWHHWRFDPATGVSDQRDWCSVDVYDVRVVGNDLLLRPPSRSDDAAGPAQDGTDEEDWLTWDVDRYFRKRLPDGGDGDGDD